ncbi:MAG: multidrug resistance efflux transporter family protein [Clostridium sp.]
MAAFSYPLGNRKVMSLVSSDISTLERVYAMTLCSLPVWIFLSIWAFITHGLPEKRSTDPVLLCSAFLRNRCYCPVL